jgi:hypothetical protein
MQLSERAAIDDSPEIDIDNLNLRNDSDNEIVENVNDFFYLKYFVLFYIVYCSLKLKFEILLKLISKYCSQ